MEIKRDKYLKDLALRMNNGLIKVITGIRRCGKSYLLNNIFYNHLLSVGIEDDHIIKFAFDSAEDLEKIGVDYFELQEANSKIEPKKFMDYVKSKIIDDGNYYLLLDEIQNLSSFEAVLNSYLRDKRIDVYVTGSNSKFLSSDIITEFRGRGDEVHIFPLVFSEYFQTCSVGKQEAFEQYLIYGGLPLLVNMQTDEQKSKHLISQVDNVYLKDIIKRNNLYANSDISELLNVLSSSVGSLTNPTKLENTFKSVKKSNISRATIDKYIGYFQDAFLISKALRYDIKGKRYIETPFKLYFEDIGLRNARLGFREIEPTHIIENIVYNELRYRGYNVDVGSVDIRQKTDEGSVRSTYEVDFVANLASKRYYIQCAYDIPDNKKWVQETKSLSAIKDSFKKIVIVERPIIPYYSVEGYAVVGLVDFLLNPNSLDNIR